MTETMTDYEEHILVCLSPSPSNPKIIRAAGEMAKVYHGRLTALYVETSDARHMEKEDKNRLQSNTFLAEQQGAYLAQVTGNDIPFEIAEYVRQNRVTKIVLGRTSGADRMIPGRPSLTDQLVANLPNVEMFIIPDSDLENKRILKRRRQFTKVFRRNDVLKTLLLLGAATAVSLGLYSLGFTEVNAITIYILGVLITSVVTDHMGYSIFASVASVVIFNYFFTEPRYTLRAYDMAYPMTFAVMFMASLITGTLAAKLKRLAKQSSEQAYRTRVLLETETALQRTGNSEQIWQTTAQQLMKLTGREVGVYPDMTESDGTDDKQHIGEQLFPVRNADEYYGKIGIAVEDEPLDVYESSIISSIMGECALALTNEKNAREKEQSVILAHNEQLRANLLRTISHDLRTPLTSISGNASNLMINGDRFDADTRKQLYTDIYDDAMWLVGLVENLLSVTRMEGEGVNLRMSIELLDDIISEAMMHLDRHKDEHEILVENEDDMLMVLIDAKLIVQVIINLINNAIKYTQKGSRILLKVWREKDQAFVSVSDNGPGITDDKKKMVFEPFYTGGTTVQDGHRSMGLGLALCKSIIEAHQGRILVRDSEEGGADFVFSLPVKEVELHE